MNNSYGSDLLPALLALVPATIICFGYVALIFHFTEGKAFSKNALIFVILGALLALILCAVWYGLINPVIMQSLGI